MDNHEADALLEKLFGKLGDDLRIERRTTVSQQDFEAFIDHCEESYFSRLEALFFSVETMTRLFPHVHQLGERDISKSCTLCVYLKRMGEILEVKV